MALDKFGPNAFATGSVTSDALATGTIATEDIADGAVTGAKAVNLGRRNLVINGAMNVAQRGTTGTSANSISYYTVDRFNFRGEPTGVYTIAKDTDAPVNFTNSTKVTVTTPDTSIPSGERYWMQTPLEGNSVSHLNLGTSNAQQFTLSFYVKSSLTGTFSGGITNNNYSRAYAFEYDISTANTWERKTITISGDTTGTWETSTACGMRIVWDLGASTDRQQSAGAWTASGSVASTGASQVIATNGATWQITGVQLEVGDSATPFEHRSYSEELALCQRYFEQKDYLNTGFVSIGYSSSGASPACMLEYSEKRTAPTITLPPAGKTTGEISFLTGVGGYATTVGSHTIQTATTFNARIQGASYSGLTSAQPSPLFFTGGASIKIDSEL
jgi:hypothetical protein